MPMPKRPAELEDGSPPSKRQRFTKDRSGKTTVNDIVSANQLQGLLAFSQDAGPDTKQSVTPC